MIRSIFITALRTILRNRSFSLINMIGLMVSMSLGMLIILIVKGQYTFDNFHADADRIYRVNTVALRTNGETEPYASTPLPLGRTLAEDYSFAEKVVRINRRLNGDATYDKVNVPLSGVFADPSFFEVFNFPLESGNPATALNDPWSLVLTHEAAEKIFGRKEPLGQTITLKGYGEFTVTGVLKKITNKTHFEFEAVGSIQVLPMLEKAGIVEVSTDDWNNYYANYVYLKLNKGRALEEVERALTEISTKHYAGLKLETRDKSYSFYLHPLGEITPGPMLSNQMGRGLPDILIAFLSALAAIVMVMACFNYTNLTIAKSLSRAREIGVRKVIGGQRWQVFIQFLGESLVFSLIAVLISYELLQLLMPAFMQLHIVQEFDISLNEDITVVLLFLLFAIVTGILAGLLPAGYLSAFKPLHVLKDAGNLRIYSRLTLRKVLMVIQFTFSLAFVIVVLVIYRQVDFMVTTDYGINDKHIVNVRLQGELHQRLMNEMAKVPGVEKIGGVSHALGTWADRSGDYKRLRSDEPFVMRDFVADGNYLSNIGVQFIAGGNFDSTDIGREKYVILNEQALPMFGFEDPASAIGQTLFVDDSVMLSVKGVVKNFHFRPLNYQIGPLAFRHFSSDMNILSMRITPGSEQQVIAALTPVWKKLDPIHPLEWKMMDEEINQAYVDAGFTDVLAIVGYITFLTIVLACLGMLGMAMYSSQTRIKEIGIRKVMGTSVPEITLLLSRSFLAMILMAVILGTPISYFLGDAFLSTYAYRINLSVWIFLGGIGIILILGILTVCSQTYRAAVSNPVSALRHE